MSDEQISLPYFVAILVVFGLIIRYLFFGGPAPQQPSRSPEAFLRSREIAVDRIQQMFPQAERRSILWDLQRNGGNIQNTTERILAGRLDTVCRQFPRSTLPSAMCTMDFANGDAHVAPDHLPTSPAPRWQHQHGNSAPTTAQAGATGPDYAI